MQREAGEAKGLNDDLMQTAEFQSYRAQVVAELQKKDLWVGVLPEEATLAILQFYNANAGILTLTPPQHSGASTVIVKICKGDISTVLPCHLALSEHGVAVPLLAHAPDFTVEAEAKPRTDEDWVNSLPGYVDNAKVTARLHGAPKTWFDGHCREVLQDYVPLLKEEPLNSSLYVAAAHEFTRGTPKEDMPQTEKLRELMKVLPRPQGEHAERLVVVHGDLWDANILHMPDGRTVLCDFEQTVVSSAVQDLIHVSNKPLVAAYLEAMTGVQPSEEEVYRLLLETKIAEHVHFFVIRALCFDAKPGNIDELTEHSRQFAVFATKLRRDPEWAKKLLGDGRDDGAWRADVLREPWNLKMDDPLVDTSDMQSFKLTLQSHPGKSVICQERFGHQFPEAMPTVRQRCGRGNWLSLGDADCALQVSYGGGSVYKTDETYLGLHIGGGNPGPVEEGNTVLMGSWSQPEFIVNQDDGTISPKGNDQLVLGHGPCNLYDLKGREMVIFVPRSSPQKLVFDALPCSKMR